MKKSLLFIGLFVMILGFWSCNNYGTKISLDDMELFYTDEITPEQAEDVLKVLDELDLTEGGEKSAQITKEGDTYQFKMVVTDGHEDDPAVELLARLIIESLSKDVFEDEPIEVHLCDDSFETIKVID